MLTNCVPPLVTLYNKSMSASQKLYKSGLWTRTELFHLRVSNITVFEPSDSGLGGNGSTWSGKKATQNVLQKYVLNQTIGVDRMLFIQETQLLGMTNYYSKLSKASAWHRTIYANHWNNFNDCSMVHWCQNQHNDLQRSLAIHCKTYLMWVNWFCLTPILMILSR